MGMTTREKDLRVLFMISCVSAAFRVEVDFIGDPRPGTLLRPLKAYPGQPLSSCQEQKEQDLASDVAQGTDRPLYEFNIFWPWRIMPVCGSNLTHSSSFWI